MARSPVNSASHGRIISLVRAITGDVLRDLYVHGTYRDVIRPFTVLHRRDSAPAPRCVVDHAGDPEYSLVTPRSDGQFLATPISKTNHSTALGSRIAEIHNGSSLFIAHAGDPDQCKVFDNRAFGHSTIVVERPLRLAEAERGRLYNAADIKELTENSTRDENASAVPKKILPLSTKPDSAPGLFETVVDGKQPAAGYDSDTEVHELEKVPLNAPAGEHADGMGAFFHREALTYAPDSCIHDSKTKTGYEIFFTRRFCKPAPMRPPRKIQAGVRALDVETEDRITEIARGSA